MYQEDEKMIGISGSIIFATVMGSTHFRTAALAVSRISGAALDTNIRLRFLAVFRVDRGIVDHRHRQIASGFFDQFTSLAMTRQTLAITPTGRSSLLDTEALGKILDSHL